MIMIVKPCLVFAIALIVLDDAILIEPSSQISSVIDFIPFAQRQVCVLHDGFSSIILCTGRISQALTRQ